MSEPSSLYTRIRLSESSLSAFQASTPKPPSQYADWREWLASQQFYGEITNAEIQAMQHLEAATVGETLANWSNHPLQGIGQATYDAITQTWTLGLLECSENYKDFILVLSLLRGIADYKDVPGEDFILIYPYMWGGAPNAYVVVTSGNSSLINEVPATVIDEASNSLQKLYETLAGNFSEDDL